VFTGWTGQVHGSTCGCCNGKLTCGAGNGIYTRGCVAANVCSSNCGVPIGSCGAGGAGCCLVRGDNNSQIPVPNGWYGQAYANYATGAGKVRSRCVNGRLVQCGYQFAVNVTFGCPASEEEIVA
jgi:hypothetical protein